MNPEAIAAFAATLAPDQAPDRDAFRRYAALGLSGLMVPQALGGSGGSYADKLAAAETLARHCFPLAFALNNTQSTPLRIALEGTEAHRRHLPGLLGGALVSALAISEPGAGSDAGAMRTLATRTADGWRLDGTKAWVTNGIHADLLLVYAQTEPGTGAKGVASFLVDLHRPGVTRTAYASAATAACSPAAIRFEGVELGAEALFAAPGTAFRSAMAGINGARVHVAAMLNGCVAACLAAAIVHAGAAESFGSKLLAHQGLRWSLAEAATQLEAARALVARAAALVGAGRDATMEAAQAKLFATRMAGPAIAAATAAAGAAALLDGTMFTRHALAPRIAAVVDGTAEMQLERIGAGLAARYG